MDELKNNGRNKRREAFTYLVLCVSMAVILSVLTLFCLKRFSPLQSKRPLPSALTSKEQDYFMNLQKTKGWKNVNREIRKVLPDEVVNGVSPTSKAYLLGVELEDSLAFGALNENIEDKIAQHLLDYVIEEGDSIRRINIFFFYEHHLGGNASEGWHRTAEYNITGKRLVKMKQQ